MSIERWNDRRIELENKALREPLSIKDRHELNLVTRCVDLYIQQAMPGYRLSSLKKLVEQLRSQGHEV